jgi:membrane protein CcdC involved in cytochrome C biogenesis
MKMNASAIFTIILVLLLVGWRRTRAMRRPIKGNGVGILYPLFIFVILVPLFSLQIIFDKSGQMSNHLLPSVTEVLIAFGLGLLFSIPMVMTTNYEVREDNQIYAKKSTAFIFALVGLVIVRLALREYFSTIDQVTLSLLSLILALGYVGVWRITSYIKFRKIWRIQMEANAQ